MRRWRSPGTASARSPQPETEAELLAPTIALAFARLWALLAVQPLWQRVVGPLWPLVAAAPALALALAIPTVTGPTDLPLLDGLVVEASFGAGLGLMVALPGYALLGALDTSERVFALRRVGSRALSVAVAASVLSLALVAGVHHPLLLAARDLQALFPLGAPGVWAALLGDGVGWMAPAVAGAAVLGLALATPALLGAAVAELTARLVAAGPTPGGVVALSVAPWARVALGLVALGVALSAYPEAWTRVLG